MLDLLFDLLKSVSGADLGWKTIAGVLLMGIPLLTRLITTIQYTLALQQTGEHKLPPTAPYSIPLVRHTLSFGLNPLKFSTILK